jgi:hypothetical protein
VVCWVTTNNNNTNNSNTKHTHRGRSRGKGNTDNDNEYKDDSDMEDDKATPTCTTISFDHDKVETRCQRHEDELIHRTYIDVVAVQGMDAYAFWTKQEGYMYTPNN